MRSYALTAVTCVVLAVTGCLPPTPTLMVADAVHPPGPGKFSDWTGPQNKYLHIYVWADESENCPNAINVIPNDAAAEVWKKAFTQPKRVVWVVRKNGESDVWTIQTKPSTEDHFGGQFETAQTIPAGDDAFWSFKAEPTGDPKRVDEKEYWKWQYNLTVKRPSCAEIPLDPPVYIRKR